MLKPLRPLHAARVCCAVPQVVFFPSYSDDGGLDPRALHEALPAVERKYVCQVRIHELIACGLRCGVLRAEYTC